MQLGNFKVEFQHNSKVGTRCVVKDPETEAVLYEGWGKIHHTDQFCRAKGRKVSFAKAIATLPREQRTDMWIDYLHLLNV